MNNNKGFATTEGLVLVPTFIAVVILLLFSTYFVIARKWADYWVYRAALCQAIQQNRIHCTRQLNNKLSIVIPSTFYKQESAWVTKKASHVSISIQVNSYYRSYSQAHIPLPFGR